MDESKLTVFCTGSGTIVGTLKGSIFSVTGTLNFDTLSEVVICAVLSSMAAYFVKRVLDWLTSIKKQKGDKL